MASKESSKSPRATFPGLSPGTYPLGSPLSRAAARAQLEARARILVEIYDDAINEISIRTFAKRRSELNPGAGEVIDFSSEIAREHLAQFTDSELETVIEIYKRAAPPPESEYLAGLSDEELNQLLAECQASQRNTTQEGAGN
jgi:hypothetical protein